MDDLKKQEQLKRCWNSCWHRARRPVEGVLLPEETATSITERSMRNVSLDFDEFPTEAEFTAKALSETAAAVLQVVAQIRRDQSNPQLHRDPEDTRYPANLDLDKLQRHDPEKGFHDREWQGLPPVLKPLAFATLSRKGIKGADAEDVFSDTLAELVREREGSGHSPILDPTVFEEIIPLHSRITSFRAVDFYRRRGALKNQPNSGSSIDALSEDPEHAMQFEDTRADPNVLTFEKIHAECREALTPAEWELIFILFVNQSATIQDLIGDDDFCNSYSIKPGVSGSTRRRVLTEIVEGALQKIRENLLF
ncbi:MAG: hypothetical protein ABJQ29_12975 [Luteolibacter sp.]